MAQRCYGCMDMIPEGSCCPHCGYEESSPSGRHQLMPGTRLGGQYLLGRVLGQGGFGITYLGWDEVLQQKVAIKEFFPNGYAGRDCSVSQDVTAYDYDGIFDKNKRRFLREAEALAKLWNKPQIVRVLRYFEENETAYIVMEYVEGITLKEYIHKQDGGCLSMEAVMKLLGPIMEALCLVHESRLVHRDISPDNIMILPDGSAKLLDFGAVRTVENPDANRNMESSTQAILKHGFAPLEQYQTHGALGPWTDVYALCATIYCCLTGKVPPEAMSRMLGEETLDWDQVSGLTLEQKLALEAGMQLQPRDRTPSARELWQALEMPEQKKRKSGGKGKLILIPAACAVCLALILGRNMKEGPAPEITEPMISATETQQVTETTQILETTVAETTQSAIELYISRAMENVLMETPTEGMYGNFEDHKAFRTGIQRKQILSITFLETLEGMPDNAIDASQSQNGTVWVWTVPNGKLYDVYIAGEGGISAPVNSYALFYGMINLKTINGRLYTGQAQDMSHMFHDCKALESLDTGWLDTQNADNLGALFNGCAALSELDLSGLDTSRVTNMGFMFAGCSGLRELDLSELETGQLTDMTAMFMGCSGLTHLNMQDFRIDRVDNLSVVFSGCASLTYLDLSSFDTTGVEWFSHMFHNCRNLQNVTFGNFDTSSVPDRFNYNNFMPPGGLVNGQPWKSWFA